MKKNSLENLGEILKPYNNIVVVGGNWGDEGKGKIIDLVMEHYDVTVRFSGGANAGHTVKTPQGVKLISHLIPCGLAQNKTCVLARGEFIDLRLFVEELEKSREILQGSLPEIWLDEMSPLWTPYHGLLEAWLEQARAGNRVGTTGKGIGPLEGLFKLRIAPLVGHLLLPKEKLKEVLEILYRALQPILESIQQESKVEIPSPELAAEQLLAFLPEIKDRIVDTSFVLDQAVKNHQRILFEGAQALGLDSHWGTYPYVSSGNSGAFGASVGTGLPMENFNATLMVVKTLPTRVGQGPFPSEMWNRDSAMSFAKNHPQLFKEGSDRDDFLVRALELINQGKARGEDYSQYFQVLGDERGATTGRGRSVGYLDIPWLQYAIRINGPKWLALTRFDMLSKVKNIPVVTGYKLNGTLLSPGKMPPPWQMEEIEIVTQNWEGWQENIFGINEEEKLPEAAGKFISRLQTALGVPILLVGTGPGREAVVVRVGQIS